MVLNTLEYSLNFFDWSERKKAKKKWLKLLEHAKNGNEDSFNFFLSQNAINEFNSYLTFFMKKERKILKRFGKRAIFLKKIEQVNDYIKSYFFNNLEARGQFNSFYFYHNSGMMRISDHFSVPQKNYININNKIYLGLQCNNYIKYQCDIVIFIPNFFNPNRKKQALLLVLNKELNIILKRIAEITDIHHLKTESKFNMTNNFYQNLNNLMIFLKENSIKLTTGDYEQT